MYLYFWSQDIHLSNFSGEHLKNADLFFLNENVYVEYFFSPKFWSVLDKPKTNIWAHENSTTGEPLLRGVFSNLVVSFRNFSSNFF